MLMCCVPVLGFTGICQHIFYYTGTGNTVDKNENTSNFCVGIFLGIEKIIRLCAA